KIFNRKGIDELSILDIGATKNNREPDLELLRDIASEAFMPLSYGGGIKTVEQIHDLLAIGYEKIVLNTALVRSPELITKAAETSMGCNDSCYNGCSVNCTDGCKGWCDGGCRTSCEGTCKNGCLGCKNTCEGSCKGYCGSNCSVSR
ncbi:MAG: hypothetical protein IKD78_07765, partial [Bacteroidales bacterium]|nr:hypothetical protein [Bacteroidales bacterium]